MHPPRAFTRIHTEEAVDLNRLISGVLRQLHSENSKRFLYIYLAILRSGFGGLEVGHDLYLKNFKFHIDSKNLNLPYEKIT